MESVALHPMLVPPQYYVTSGHMGERIRSRGVMHSRMAIGSMGAGMGGGLGGIGDFFTGLFNALADVLGAIIKTIQNIVTSVLKALDSILTGLNFANLLNNLGVAIKFVSNIVVKLNPLRLTYNFLETNPLTRHAFQQLDKFTGGMLTSAVNVSDLVFRAARGDAITTREFLQDAVFILQVAAVWVGGPVAAFAILGGLVGNQACKSIKNKTSQTACKAAFTILGAATGATYVQYLANQEFIAFDNLPGEFDASDPYYQDMLDSDADIDATFGPMPASSNPSGAIDVTSQTEVPEFPDVPTSPSGAIDVSSIADQPSPLSQTSSVTSTDLSSEAGDEFANLPEVPEKGFTDYLSDSAQKTLENKVVSTATQIAIRACQLGNWTSPEACSILGKIGSDFINAPEGTDWPTFFATEAANIGILIAVQSLFPPKSPEGIAIAKILPKYTQTPNDTKVINQINQTSQSTSTGLWLLAGAAALAFVGAIA